MPRKFKSNTRKTGFKDPKSAKYEYNIKRLSIGAGVIIVIILIVSIIFIGDSFHEKIIDGFFNILTFSVGAILGRLTKK